MKRQLYVARGNNPREWSETNLAGPFESEAQARIHIHTEVMDFVNAWGEFSVGKQENTCEQYHVMELVKSFAPEINIKASVSLKIKEREKE